MRGAFRILSCLMACFFLYVFGGYTLRKHAYSNVLKILQPKKENFQIKNSDMFHMSAQNIAGTR